jgi:hypothetical protein
MKVTFIDDFVTSSRMPWYTGITMEEAMDKVKKENVRRLVKEAIVTCCGSINQTDLTDAQLLVDATNPYAFVVRAGGKLYRVVVKEME